MANVDGLSMLHQRPIDDIDRPNHARTKTSGLSQINLHHRTSPLLAANLEYPGPVWKDAAVANRRVGILSALRDSATVGGPNSRLSFGHDRPLARARAPLARDPPPPDPQDPRRRRRGGRRCADQRPVDDQYADRR